MWPVCLKLWQRPQPWDSVGFGVGLTLVWFVRAFTLSFVILPYYV